MALNSSSKIVQLSAVTLGGGVFKKATDTQGKVHSATNKRMQNLFQRIDQCIGASFRRKLEKRFRCKYEGYFTMLISPLGEKQQLLVLILTT